MDNLAIAKLPPNTKNGTMASFGDDTGIYATFDDDFVKNEYKSEMEGRVVLEHFICIELQFPGDNTKTNKFRFTADEGNRGNQWTHRFPRQWEAYKSSKEQTPDGTPIEMWPPLDKKRVFELKASKIFTVEQIAALTDQTGPVALGMEWRKMRDQADAFLHPNMATVQLSKLMRENEDKDRRMAILEQQIASLQAGARMGSHSEEPKKRGRRPKIQPTE
jgi:hypothetical protein